MFWIIFAIIILFILYDVIASIFRKFRRRELYKKALKRSQETGKPLLVIGDPDNGFSNKYFGRDYGCGDMCIDLIGCKGCPYYIKDGIANILPLLSSNSYVIYISCVLEYVNSSSIDKIISELGRVAGDDLYVVTVDPYSLSSLCYYGSLFTNEGGAKRLILTTYPHITYYEL